MRRKKKSFSFDMQGWLDIRDEITDWTNEVDITIHKSKIRGENVKEVRLTIKEVT